MGMGHPSSGRRGYDLVDFEMPKEFQHQVDYILNVNLEDPNTAEEEKLRLFVLHNQRMEKWKKDCELFEKYRNQWFALYKSERSVPAVSFSSQFLSTMHPEMTEEEREKLTNSVKCGEGEASTVAFKEFAKYQLVPK
jgi:DNA gyrase inhibitor GyrI